MITSHKYERNTNGSIRGNGIDGGMIYIKLTEDKKDLLRELKNIPEGVYTLEVYSPQHRRTERQNRAIHALFHDLSDTLNAHGIDLTFGKFRATFTPVTAKEFFKEIYLGGKHTSECTTSELAKAVDALLFDINTKLGASLEIKEPLK